MVKYTLSYLDIRGRAEPARMILSYGKADWEDVRIPWVGIGASPIPDAIKARSPYGQVPILEFDGKVLAQSNTVGRYLAQQFGLAGKDDFEAAKANEIVDATNDVAQLFWVHMGEKDAEKKAEGLKGAAKKAKEVFFSKFNEYATVNGGYLVGGALTWADIAVACGLESLQKMTGTDFTEGFPALKQVSENVFGAPGIKEWIASRPDTLF